MSQAYGIGAKTSPPAGNSRVSSEERLGTIAAVEATHHDVGVIRSLARVGPSEDRSEAMGNVAGCSLAWEVSAERALTTQTARHEQQDSPKDCSDWESNFERHGPSVPEGERRSQRFLETVIANVEAARALRTFSEKRDICRKDINTLETGRGGINEILVRINELPDDGSPSRFHKLKEAQKELDKFRKMVEKRRADEEDADTLLQHECREQQRRDTRLYGLIDGMIVPASSNLQQFPPDFWMQLYTCRDLAEAKLAKEQELEALISERATADDDVDAAAVKDFWWQAAKEQQPDHEAGRQRMSVQRKLRSSKRVLQLARRRERADAELAKLHSEQIAAEVALNRRVEDIFISKGWLVSARNQQASHDAPGECQKQPDAPAGAYQRCCTPTFTSPARRRQAEEAQSELLDAAKKRLRSLLRNELNSARDDFKRAERSLDTVENDQPPIKLTDPPDIQEQQSHAYFLEKSRRTRELIEAEVTFVGVLRRAQDADLEGVEARSEGFSEHESDGYAEAVMVAHRVETEPELIRAWLDEAEEAHAEGFWPVAADVGSQWVADGAPEQVTSCPPLSPNALKLEQEVPVLVLTDAEVGDCRSLCFGESYSTVGEGRSRRLVDQVVDQWRAGDDGFRKPVI